MWSGSVTHQVVQQFISPVLAFCLCNADPLQKWTILHLYFTISLWPIRRSFAMTNTRLRQIVDKYLGGKLCCIVTGNRTWQSVCCKKFPETSDCLFCRGWFCDINFVLGMYRISAPAPIGPASGPLLEVRPRSGSGQNYGRIWPDLGQPFCGHSTEL